ncbi:DUF1617 family protein [Ignavigranum ruoffiae]|uniref:DUF1617 family protein n=1 Tax=Ignavigranum ruoffiae TaxID=89093 RepID=UPI003AFF9719
MKINHGTIFQIYHFLEKMTLKGKPSISRAQLKRKVFNKIVEYQKMEQDLLEEYNVETNDQGKFSLDNKEFSQALYELRTMEVEISIDEIPFMDTFIKSIIDYEGDLSGQDADAHAELYSMLVGDNNVGS